MVSRSFELVVTCLIGAHVALLFSLGLIAWNSRLDDERVIRTEAWRLSPPEQRRAGRAGRRWARSTLGELALRFAKGSAMVAIALSAAALVELPAAPAIVVARRPFSLGSRFRLFAPSGGLVSCGIDRANVCRQITQDLG
jgi:hypothetical protein